MPTGILICIDRKAADLDKLRDEDRLFAGWIINIASVVGFKETLRRVNWQEREEIVNNRCFEQLLVIFETWQYRPTFESIENQFKKEDST